MSIFKILKSNRPYDCPYLCLKFQKHKIRNKMSNRIEGKSIIITGASSGIGEATALLLAQKGAKVTLAARREDRLKELSKKIEESGGQVIYTVTDVSKRSEVEAMVQSAVSHFGQVDVLINNAGLMPLSFFSQNKVEEWDKMVDVNIKGVLYGISSVIGLMRAQESGHIINIASIAGHKVFPTGGVYCATKHAVRAISEGLRQEEQTIRTTIISPGIVKTELPNTISDEKLSAGTDQAYLIGIESEDIARGIVYAIEQPDSVDINEIIIRPVVQKS